MTTYHVTFEYTIEVEADSEEQADSLAWSDWVGNFGSVAPTDFIAGEPWEVVE